MFATLISLIGPAMSVIGAFKGSAVEAKINNQVQDALGVVNAVMPLINQVGSGKEVSPDDVRIALAGKDAAIGAFDELIAQKGG